MINTAGFCLPVSTTMPFFVAFFTTWFSESATVCFVRKYAMKNPSLKVCEPHLLCRVGVLSALLLLPASARRFPSEKAQRTQS